MKNPLRALLMISALGGMAGCDTYPTYGEVRMHDREYDVRVVFSEHDRSLIRDYYRRDTRRLPPGLAKQGKIPPGHAFRMQRHKAIPPGVAWDPLPADLDRRLSRLPEGYVRIVIGGNVAILNTQTRIVLDLVESLDD